MAERPDDRLLPRPTYRPVSHPAEPCPNAERPDPDTDPNTLAEYFVEWADSVDPLWQGGFCSDNDALRERAMNARAAADGLRQYAKTEAELTRFKALNEQGHRRNMEVLAEFYELQKQYAAITAAIGDPDELIANAHYGRAANGHGDDLFATVNRIAAAVAEGAEDRGQTHTQNKENER